MGRSSELGGESLRSRGRCRAQKRRVAVSSSTASSGPDVMVEFEVGYVTSDQRLLGHLEDALKDLERAVDV